MCGSNFLTNLGKYQGVHLLCPMGKTIFSSVRKCQTASHPLFLLVQNLFFSHDLPHSFCTKGHICLLSNSTPCRVWLGCNVTNVRSRFHKQSGARRPNLCSDSYTDLSHLSTNWLFPLIFASPFSQRKPLAGLHLCWSLPTSSDQGQHKLC